MLQTAQAEVERIQIVQDAHVSAGLLKKPDAVQQRRRDDFAGMVRLIEIIEGDKVMLERIQAGRSRLGIIQQDIPVEVEPE